MFDVFYYGPKPNLFDFEQHAENIDAAATQCKTGFFWYIYGGNDYTNFDFDLVPVPWERDHLHVFPSQYQENGEVYLAHKDTVHTRQWHARTEQSVTRRPAQIYYMDFMNPENKQFDALKEQHPTIKRTRYVDNHLAVIERVVNSTDQEYIWVIGSVNDYTGFDFSWHPPEDQKEMIHCFSNEGMEKRGDTFYIPVKSFRSQIYDLELLDWFNVINYINAPTVRRWPVPVNHYTGDSLIETIRNHEFTAPYEIFANRDFGQMFHVNDCLWSEKDRWCRPMSTSSGISVIPRDIKKYLRTQIYDYPYLWKYKQEALFNYYADQALDVVYISNGEPDADQNFEHLRTVLRQKSPTADFPRFSNRLHRISGINGRVAAYQAAARVSKTPWFFAVFAKLVVDENFDFRWQPDMWQEPKHYIFNALNVVNGLEYGHMAMIAYNQRLVLENNNPGIDFTLSQAHESVPILSGTAHFNQDSWTTWRTAFREALKLRMFMETSPTLETEHRLNIWCNFAAGNYSNYSKQGAQDAMTYYDEVAGDPAKLQLSFDWAWLKERFNGLGN